jgi:asparagine synthase (glutamine-hydrolysing)
MCGIDGAIRLWPEAPPLDLAAQERIRTAQARRGPDGPGQWLGGDGSLVLGHRRLAIVDLSPGGAQPMASADGQLVVVNNGEIYNYRALRAELAAAGVRLRTASDTEVILALYAREGRQALRRLRGMFALALWDARRQTLLLVRDPLGIKPLYYAVGDDGILRFASQVKALEAGGLAPALEPAAVLSFLLWGAVSEPWTIRRAARALPAGHLLAVELPALAAQPRGSRRLPEPEAYCPSGPWSAEELAQGAAVTGVEERGGWANALAAVPSGGEPAVSAVSRALRGSHPSAATLSPAAALAECVALHLESDVPVALFLSAGLDSSLVAALAAREARRLGAPLPTALTLRIAGSEGTPADEVPLAAETARVLGLRHEVRTLDLHQLASRFDEILAAMDQPSIDGANTFLISEVAHQAGFRVVLSGLGGDELFGSYPSFRDVPRLERLARGLGAVPGGASLWRAGAVRLLGGDRPKLGAVPTLGRSLAGAYLLRRGLFLPHELPALLPSDLLAAGLAAYDPLQHLEQALRDGLEAGANTGEHARIGGQASAGSLDGLDPWLAVHHLETVCYMRHQLLRDSDWAAMAHSLELRVPLVDPWLRGHLAAANFEPARRRGKATLVRAVAPELPAAVFARRKSGFHVPLARAVAGDAAAPTHGLGSRELARRVLAGWGVVLRGAEAGGRG